MEEEVRVQLSPELLNKYLAKFQFDVREKVLASIMKCEIVKKAMCEKTVNKLLTDFYIRTINKTIIEIIASCLDWKSPKKARAEKVIELGDRVGMMLNALSDVSNIINEGEKHINDIKKLKGESHV